MSRIALEAESHFGTLDNPKCAPTLTGAAVDDRVTDLAIELARRVSADAIITPTLSERTARPLARHRPRAAIVAPAPSAVVVRRLAAVWGVQPVQMANDFAPGADRIGGAVEAAVAAEAAGAVSIGALVVVLAGHPVDGRECLPTIRLLRVADGGRTAEP